MKFSLENKKLTLFFVGNLNSNNAEDVENEIENIIGDKSIDSIVIDMENLSYISSAGLRIIARLKKKYSDTSLVKVKEDVYDIFEMVNFQNMMTIEKL
jgi:anti-anti-sigma factor